MASLHQAALQSAEAFSDPAAPLFDQEPETIPIAAETPSLAEPFDPRAITPDQIEALYVEHRKLLLFVASRKFRIAEEDAENLIQEVFLSLLQTTGRIENVRAWLVAAMCNSSRYYWRVHGRTEPLPDGYGDQRDPRSDGLADRFAMRMTIQKVLGYLQPRCRETLRLHYFEGRSAADVARELDTTHRYAEKLIHNCLGRAREIYRSITSIQP